MERSMRVGTGPNALRTSKLFDKLARGVAARIILTRFNGSVAALLADK